MNTSPNDRSDSAFPSADGFGGSYPGMTLRDYFAGRALVGILAGWMKNYVNDAELAVWSYRIADEMLAARAGKGGVA